MGSLAFGADYYVAPNGSDKNPGTLESPFASIVAARDALRNTTHAEGKDSTVYLRGGIYRLDRKITFGPEDSGKPDARIIYRNFGSEKPVLSGGEAVGGWQLHDPAKNIYKANVGKDLFRQVYINGEMAKRSRYPHGTPVDGPYLRMLGGDGKNHRVQIKASEWKKVAAQADPKTLELVYLLHWTEFRAKIASATVDGDSVWLNIVAPEPKSFFCKPDKWFPNQPYCFENAPGFVSEEGEWFHDASTGWLYLKAPKDLDLHKALVEIPRLSTLIEISGTPEKPVHDLEFQGLGMELSNWTRPSERGLPATQFVQPYDTAKIKSFDNLDWPQGLIKAQHATRLGIRNCLIRNAGATGIQFWQDVDDSDIEGNEICHVAANAIEIDASIVSNPKPDQQSENVAIWNNHIHHAGQNYTNGGALLAHFVKGLVVDHNEIHDLPYGGIQVGDQPPHKDVLDLGCTANKIRFNHIYRVMQLHDDCGAIYTLGGAQKGTRIFENYLHDILRSKWAGGYHVAAVYLDNFTNYVAVERNVIENCDKHTPYGSFNGSANNIFIDNDGHDPAVKANAGVLKGYNPRKESGSK